MATEAGDMKLLGNFRKLIDFLTAEPSYAPPNPQLTIATMQAQDAEALAAAKAVGTNMAPNKVAITERQLAFDQLPIILPRSRNVLRASGAPKEIIADVDTSYNKVLGRRKTPKIKTDPNTPANEATVQHSALQTSYDNQFANVGSYIAILKEIPQYNPNDPSLKISALETLAADLLAKNNAVSATFVPLSQARGRRDNLLYLNANCVVNTALLAKVYVAGEFGTKSNLYKQIKGLSFKRASFR